MAGQGYLVAVPEVYHEYEPLGTVLNYDQVGTDRGNEVMAHVAAKLDLPLAANCTAVTLGSPASVTRVRSPM